MRVLIGEKYKGKLSQGLAAQGIEAIFLPNNTHVDTRLSGHADLMICRVGEEAIAVKQMVKYLTNMGCSAITADREQNIGYPQDAGMCVCLTGKYAIYNPRTADPQVSLRIREYIPVRVAQGYSKCAVCVVDEDSIITADRGIAAEAVRAGMDVLAVEPGHILLDGFRDGFIGGATFQSTPDKLFFTGTLNDHPDKNRILDYLQRKHVKPVFLTDEPLFDIGSAVELPHIRHNINYAE
jgi:hypothetical protein